MTIYLCMGCFWSVEKTLSELFDFDTEVGYANEGRECVKVSLPESDLNAIIKFFWQYHYSIQDKDFPVPLKYSSAIYADDLTTLLALKSSKKCFIENNGFFPTTDIDFIDLFNLADGKHQKRFLNEKLISSLKKYDFIA